jgi:hypothetical protein
MKTRSSSGVGSKVDLAFNNKSLRITDLEEDDNNDITASTTKIYDQLKKKSIVRSGDKKEPESSDATSMTQNDRKVDTLEGAAALRSFLKKR